MDFRAQYSKSNTVASWCFLSLCEDKIAFSECDPCQMILDTDIPAAHMLPRQGGSEVFVVFHKTSP